MNPSLDRILAGCEKPGWALRVALGGMRLAQVPNAATIWLRNRAYDHLPALVGQAGIPVISVGNLTVGGTGKTPVVRWIAAWLRHRHLSVAILSRGYRALPDGENDEARELRERLGDVRIVQRPDRLAAARQIAENGGTDIIILDDGFQHRRLHRDLDLLLVDATCPVGHDSLLPRGLLREPVREGRRADVIGLTRSDAVEESQRAAIRAQWQATAPLATWLEIVQSPTGYLTGDGRTLPVASLHGAHVAAFCGIANPLGFQHTLCQAGLQLVGLRTFPDHYHFGTRDMELLAAWVSGFSGLHAVVCTHKDYVKLPAKRLADLPVYALSIDVQINVGQKELERHLERVIRLAVGRNRGLAPSG